MPMDGSKRINYGFDGQDTVMLAGRQTAALLNLLLVLFLFIGHGI